MGTVEFRREGDCQICSPEGDSNRRTATAVQKPGRIQIHRCLRRGEREDLFPLGRSRKRIDNQSTTEAIPGSDHRAGQEPRRPLLSEPPRLISSRSDRLPGRLKGPRLKPSKCRYFFGVQSCIFCIFCTLPAACRVAGTRLSLCSCPGLCR